MGNGYIGIMEKKMETTRAYRDYIGIMENRMETAIQGLGLRGFGVATEKKIEITIMGYIELKMPLFCSPYCILALLLAHP